MRFCTPTRPFTIFLDSPCACRPRLQTSPPQVTADTPVEPFGLVSIFDFRFCFDFDFDFDPSLFLSQLARCLYRGNRYCFVLGKVDLKTIDIWCRTSTSVNEPCAKSTSLACKKRSLTDFHYQPLVAKKTDDIAGQVSRLTRVSRSSSPGLGQIICRYADMQLSCMPITCRIEKRSFPIRCECLTGVPVQDYTKKATRSYFPYRLRGRLAAFQ